jgi:type II secretory pathway predicted ATPase ExeA
MVPSYYNMAEQPFGVTPDRRFLFHSPTHREALASLRYGVSANRGFTSLIAKPGMGKTTLLFRLLNEIELTANTAFLFQPQYTPQDLMVSLLTDLGIDHRDANCATMQRRLIDFLHLEATQGRQLVVVIDEAQNLDESLLEMLRMLSNFESMRQKLMHLILVGQPQLAEKLAAPNLAQLRQRISIFAQLRPFSPEETCTYIDHRLRVAGYDRNVPLFSNDALSAIVRHAEGIPRNINNLCFNAMSLGCALGKRTIGVSVIEEVARDLDLRKMYAEPARKKWFAVPGFHERAVTQSRSGAHSILRFALSGLLMILAGFAVGRATRLGTNPTTPASALASTLSNEPEMHTLSAVAEPIDPAISSSPEPMDSTHKVTKTIQVRPDETLSHIIIENLGKYDDTTLAQVRILNPWLQDPDRIEAGQRIRLPGKTNGAGLHSPARLQSATIDSKEVEKR